jgi:hypothetical protein
MRVSRLKALHEVNREGLVVLNLVKFPATGYQGLVDPFGNKLRSRMAALDHGPLHVGRTVALEKMAKFDRIYIIYYPSARYFADMLSSQYFNSVTGNPSKGDALRVATVPITTRLLP